jgi:hypothetical protein
VLAKLLKITWLGKPGPAVLVMNRRSSKSGISTEGAAEADDKNCIQTFKSKQDLTINTPVVMSVLNGVL